MPRTSACIRNTYWVVAAIFVLAPLPSFGKPADYTHVYSTADWLNRLEDCFDSCGNTKVPLLTEFVRAAEASRVQPGGEAGSLRVPAPVSLLSDAYMQQGRLEDAKALLTMPPISAANSDSSSRSLPTTDYEIWRALHLSAIAASHKRYGEAAILNLA